MVRTLGNITLTPEQEKGVLKLKNGNILRGGVGSGKTFMSIFWASSFLKSRKLYVITTAMKRDLVEPGDIKPDWQTSLEECGFYDYTIDSWNNIKKYEDVSHALFLFDEQGASGSGQWAKSFIKIAKNDNLWIILSATPGDVWTDYIPVFIANGFYKNRSEFLSKHVEYDRYAKYPKIKAFHGTALLEKYRNLIEVPVLVLRHTHRQRHLEYADYNKELYHQVKVSHFNYETNEPIENASSFVQLLRKIVATSPQRKAKAYEIMWAVPKLIVFYNYDYERDILRQLCKETGKPYSEWSGHLHEPQPEGERWIYLMQYTAGNKGPNFTSTDSILFYSPNYSYKVIEQAEGRIDRMDTPFKELHYYYLQSHSDIDRTIMGAIANKKLFNEKSYAGVVSSYYKTQRPIHRK